MLFPRVSLVFLCYRFEMRPFPTFLYEMVRLKKGIAVSSCYVVYQGHNGMCGGAMPSKSTMYTHPFFGSQMHPSFSSSSPRIFSIHIYEEKRRLFCSSDDYTRTIFWCYAIFQPETPKKGHAELLGRENNLHDMPLLAAMCCKNYHG